MTETDKLIADFLAAPRFAVVGASNDPAKYGAQVFAAYRARGLEVYPVNPKQPLVQGERAYAALVELPARVPSVSIVTPPAATELVVEDAARAGVQILWMQPGSESHRAVARAAELGLAAIHGGPCVLVALDSARARAGGRGAQ